MFSYDCEDQPTPDQIMQPVMDTLSNAYQLQGNLQSSTLGSLDAAMNNSSLCYSHAAADIYGQLLSAINTPAQTRNQSQQLIATQLYGVAGSAIANGSNCCCKCQDQCGTQSTTSVQVNEQYTPLPITPFDCISPIPGPYQADVYGGKIPVTETQQIPFVGVQPTIPIKFPPVVPTVPGQREKHYVLYCNDKTGDKIIVPEGFVAPDGYVLVLLSTLSNVQRKSDEYVCGSTPEEPYKPEIINIDNSNASYVSIGTLCGDGDYSPTKFVPSVNWYTEFKVLLESSAKVIESFVPAGEKIGKVLNIFEGFFNVYGDIFGCGNQQSSILIRQQVVGDAIAKLTGVSQPNARGKLQYAINSFCPYIRPSASDSLNAYLANRIDETTLREWVQTDGHCYEPWKKQIDVHRKKVSPGDGIELYRRKIWTISQLYESHREQGYLKHGDTDLLVKLTEYLPGFGQVMGWLQNDTANDGFANKWELDDGLAEAKQGELKEWIENNAVSDKVLKHAWRGHWSPPGFGELSELHYRMRDSDTPDNHKVTIDRVRDAMTMGNVVPWWSDRMIDTIYRPISRWDLRPAYNVGAIKDKQLEISYHKLGYSDDDSKVLVEHARLEKREAITSSRPMHYFERELINAKQCVGYLDELGYDRQDAQNAVDIIASGFRHHSAIVDYKEDQITYDECVKLLTEFGIPQSTISKLVDGVLPTLRYSVALKQLKAYTISPDEAKTRLKQEGVNSTIADKVVDEFVATSDAEFSRKCVDGIRKRFMGGELSENDSALLLQQNGIDFSWATKLSDTWKCEKSAIGKQLPASQQCQAYSQGLITATEFHDSLVNVGYNADTADVIIGQCTIKLVQQHDAMIAKQIAANQREVDRQNKARDKYSADAEKRSARAKKAGETAQKAMATRQKNLMSIAAHYAKLSKVDGVTATDAIVSIFEALQQQPNVSKDIAIAAIQKALDLTKDYTPENILTLAYGAIEETRLALQS